MHTQVRGSTIHRSQKVEATQVASGGQMDKQMCLIYIMEIYSALKREEVLSYATTGVTRREILWSEVSQSQENEYYLIPLM